MYPDSYQIIERGVQTIGLNIQELKYLIVGHGHADNTEAHGTSNIPTQHGNNSTKSAKDGIIEDEQFWTLSSTTFQFYITPGHTTGTVSTIFNTNDKSTAHKGAQWGGIGFCFAGAKGEQKIDWFETYAVCAERFRGLIRENGANVLIADHCVLDNTYAKSEAIENANATSPNPWASGVEWTANYTQVAESCARAGIAAYASMFIWSV